MEAGAKAVSSRMEPGPHAGRAGRGEVGAIIRRARALSSPATVPRERGAGWEGLRTTALQAAALQ